MKSNRTPVRVAVAQFEDIVAHGLRALINEDDSLNLVADGVPHTQPSLPALKRTHANELQTAHRLPGSRRRTAKRPACLTISKQCQRGSGPVLGGPKRGTPAAKAAGAQRRVIEGEGLGGFARRHTFNAWPVSRFLAALRFFCCQQGFWDAIFWCWPGAGTKARALPAGLKDRRER